MDNKSSYKAPVRRTTIAIVLEIDHLETVPSSDVEARVEQAVFDGLVYETISEDLQEYEIMSFDVVRTGWSEEKV